MNTKGGLGEHPGEDLFEDYFFDRLSEQATGMLRRELADSQECQASRGSSAVPQNNVSFAPLAPGEENRSQ